MMLFCESCERGIEIPKHATEVTCSCGERYEIDSVTPDYKRIVTDRQGNRLDVRTMGHPHSRLHHE